LIADQTAYHAKVRKTLIQTVPSQ